MHHIIPRCLGGSNEKENLVALTPEEHYVAHQLLVKIYPDNSSLTYAALKMVHGRSNNKWYGWLKKRYQKISKQRTGSKNGSYGKSWFHDPTTLKNIKCTPDEVPKGYIKGRKLKKALDKKETQCVICKANTGSSRRKYCDNHRSQVQKENAQIAGEKAKQKFFNDENYRNKSLENFKKGRVQGIKRGKNKNGV